MINLCFEFSTESTNFIDNSDYKVVYEKFYKPLVSFLYSHEDFHFSFYFSGPEFDFIRQKNPEFIEILKKLVNRKQVEILGGGYFNPIFPLLFPQDRTGQVELLSSTIRKAFGKRPRGLSLFVSAWDPSLVTTFDACGMEFVQLDSSLVQKEKNLFLPIVMADRGKSIKILLTQNDLIPSESENFCDDCDKKNTFDVSDNCDSKNSCNPFENSDAEIYIQSILKRVSQIEQNDEINIGVDRTIAIVLTKNSATKFLNESWLNNFINLINEKYSDKIKINLPTNCIRQSTAFVQNFIHSGISRDIAKWAKVPYKKSEPDSSINIYDFMQTYKRSQALYNRMIFVSLLVNNCHGDKMRKKNARDYLWAAQTGDAYVCKSSGVLVSSQERQSAYQKLTDAEKLIRESESFSEAISGFDYDCDGFKEYVCRMEKFNACISPRGGSIFELDVMKKSGNYADNMSRVEYLDNCSDNYEKGFFIDHLFEPEEYESYIKGRSCKNGVFSGKIYRELSFNALKHEFCLEADSVFPNLSQTVTIKKKYIVSSSGIMVQYILKNTSPIALKAKFVVESNFAQTCFKKDSFDSYKIDVVNNDQIEEKTANNLEFMQNASAFQLTDLDNNISFTFEPNESANVVSYPIVFMRRKTDSENLEPVGRTLSVSLAWDVYLPADFEMEKTINLTITSIKKRK